MDVYYDPIRLPICQIERDVVISINKLYTPGEYVAHQTMETHFYFYSRNDIQY